VHRTDLYKASERTVIEDAKRRLAYEQRIGFVA